MELPQLEPAVWAAEHLAQALKARGTPRNASSAKVQDAGEWEVCSIVAAGAGNASAKRMLHGAGISVANVPEALALASVHEGGRPVLLACGHDARGLVYALTEMADVVLSANDSRTAMNALAAVETTTEQPANEVRSMMRSFCSDVEDKPWYNDRAMWPGLFRHAGYAALQPVQPGLRHRI